MTGHPASQADATTPEGQPAPTESSVPTLLEYPATYALIASNLLIFLLMSLHGPLVPLLRTPSAGGLGTWLGQLFTAPFSEHALLGFGACTPDDVLGRGQWWRLVTSTFVHVTVLHLLLNMWCLWNLGIFGERLLGKPGLIAVYLLTGAAGMLQSVILSVVTHEREVIVAGASGAVFGIAGILIVLLSNRRLAAPWKELRSLRWQVVFFAVANLALGAAPNLLARSSPGLLRGLHLGPGALPVVDNSAHLGGFCMGFLLGVPLFPRMTSTRSSYRARQALVFSSAALLLLLVSYALWTFVHGPVPGRS